MGGNMPRIRRADGWVDGLTGGRVRLTHAAGTYARTARSSATDREAHRLQKKDLNARNPGHQAPASAHW